MLSWLTSIGADRPTSSTTGVFETLVQNVDKLVPIMKISISVSRCLLHKRGNYSHCKYRYEFREVDDGIRGYGRATITDEL